MLLLLVEDDWMIGESMAALLRTEHYLVDWVRNAIDAQQAIAGFAYDLLLLDMGLPGAMTGAELLGWYRQQGGAAPVLIVTALYEIPAAVRAAADAWLFKPFDLEALLSSIRSLLPAVPE